MAYLNSNQYIGNIGTGGVKVHTFEQSGDKIGRASLAVTKRWTKESGEKGERTTWIPLMFPSHLVENAAKFVTQGRQVFVEGELETREYEKDGQKHTAFEIRVSNYQLLGKKPEDSGDSAE